MRTKADEKVEEALKHIEDSIKCLSEVIIDKCWGYNDYSEDTKDRLIQLMSHLLMIGSTKLSEDD